MEENTVVNLLAIETITPKWRIARSPGAVYIMLIALVIACISIGNLLYENWQIARHITQPVLYAMIAISGIYLYRRHYICYRYTLTDELLAIEEVGGRSEKTIGVVALKDIQAISLYLERNNYVKSIKHASLPPKDAQTVVYAMQDAIVIGFAISASEEFVNKLTAQWKTCAESIQ